VSLPGPPGAGLLLWDAESACDGAGWLIDPESVRGATKSMLDTEAVIDPESVRGAAESMLEAEAVLDQESVRGAADDDAVAAESVLGAESESAIGACEATIASTYTIAMSATSRFEVACLAAA
jgi:hypothetical protein